MLCKKNERGLVYATQSGGPQKTSGDGGSKRGGPNTKRPVGEIIT